MAEAATGNPPGIGPAVGGCLAVPGWGNLKGLLGGLASKSHLAAVGNWGERGGDVGNSLASYPYLQPAPPIVHSSRTGAAVMRAASSWGCLPGCLPAQQRQGGGRRPLDLSHKHFGTSVGIFGRLPMEP